MNFKSIVARFFFLTKLTAALASHTVSQVAGAETLFRADPQPGRNRDACVNLASAERVRTLARSKVSHAEGKRGAPDEKTQRSRHQF